MKKTAQHIASSPNPAQLELRILANHGGDKRFAFLKGRWSRRWKIINAVARKASKPGEDNGPPSVGGALGGLATYSDSDSDDAADTPHDKQADQRTESAASMKKEVEKTVRRTTKLREWSQKRRQNTKPGTEIIR